MKMTNLHVCNPKACASNFPYIHFNLDNSKEFITLLKDSILSDCVADLTTKVAKVMEERKVLFALMPIAQQNASLKGIEKYDQYKQIMIRSSISCQEMLELITQEESRTDKLIKKLSKQLRNIQLDSLYPIEHSDLSPQQIQDLKMRLSAVESSSRQKRKTNDNTEIDPKKVCSISNLVNELVDPSLIPQSNEAPFPWGDEKPRFQAPLTFYDKMAHAGQAIKDKWECGTFANFTCVRFENDNNILALWKKGIYGLSLEKESTPKKLIDTSSLSQPLYEEFLGFDHQGDDLVTLTDRNCYYYRRKEEKWSGINKFNSSIFNSKDCIKIKDQNVFIGDKKGVLRHFKIAQDKCDFQRVFKITNSCLHALDIHSDKQILGVGSSSQKAFLYNIEYDIAIETINFRRMVTAVHFINQHTFVAGSASGQVIIKDLRVQKNACLLSKTDKASVSDIKSMDSQSLMINTYQSNKKISSGEIKIWDLRKNQEQAFVGKTLFSEPQSKIFSFDILNNRMIYTIDQAAKFIEFSN